MFSNRPAAADIRAGVLDPVQVTRKQTSQLHGESRARCPRTDDLPPDGADRLGYPVSVCPDPTDTGGTY